MKGIYVVTSKMLGQQKQLGHISDNVANVNTTGFKRANHDFGTYISRQEGQRVAAFSQDRGTFVDYTEGQLDPTQNPFNAAIIGEGFFGVEVNGNVHYTRNGNFGVDPEGNLIDSSGNFVVDNNNGPIQLPAAAKDFVISKDGAVSTEFGLVAQLGIFEFAAEDKMRLMRAGNTGYAAPAGVEPVASENPTVAQKYLEQSNVSPIKETVHMTEMMRSYQSSARLIKSMEELEQRAIRSLSAQP